MQVGELLLDWFSRSKRAFPWRAHYDTGYPYAILFAEVMLQRTRAAQVARVYTEFISRYPTLRDLLDADDGEVLSILRPLGLNWRNAQIIQLIRALRVQGGRTPQTLDDLLDLPGVGEYAATAFMVYAHGSNLVALDTNSMRIISRVFGLDYHQGSKPTNLMRNHSKSIIPAGRAKEFNMALMDFGGLVCTPREPDCPTCPINTHCEYFRRTGR